VNDKLRWFANSPGAQLVVGAAILALAYPATASGAVGLVVLAGALGIGFAAAWPQFPPWLRVPPARLATAFIVLSVTVAGIAVFWDALTVTPDWQMGDWGPQRAALAHVMPHLPGLHVPVWNHAVSTGDAPLELYPALTYLVTGHLALLLGLSDDLPRALMVTAVFVHVLLAITTMLIAARLAPKPIALAVGLLVLVDSGAVAHGGTVGLFRWALLHSALALAFASIAALGVISALQRPRIGASVTIWIFVALATATHPAALIGAAAAGIALLAVALLAADVPPRRALAALGHIGVGVALGAIVWMPMAARILQYGQHYPNPVRSPAQLLENLLAFPSPYTAWAMLAYAGYFGIIAGIWSRRGAVIFVAATALVLLVGLCDMPYLALDLAPGRGIARLGTERLAQLARPFIFAAGAYGVSIFIGHAIRAWRGAPPRQRMVAAALIGVMTAMVVRTLPPMWRSATARAIGETRVDAPDLEGRQQMEIWAAAKMREIGPGSWARALFEEDTHEHLHLTAITGLPTLHLPPLPDMLLRERIEDMSPASLARYNVRWVVAIGSSPTIGEAASEQIFGTYHVREVAGWDGKFARIERGKGSVVVTRLDDEAVEIDVTADAPVLVALGTGYYPRWRAQHASGADEPVYAFRATPMASTHVVSAWVLPGHTTFTADGPLPSDHDGRLFSIAAALFGLASIIAWSRPRWRVRILRRVARVRAEIPRYVRPVARVAVPFAILALLVRSCSLASQPVRDLEVGSGIRGVATVEALGDDGTWETCDYDRVVGEYRCNGAVSVYDGMANTINDLYPSWSFNTPAIIANADRPVEVKITLHERLGGTYWTAAGSGRAELVIEGDLPRMIDNRTVITLGEIGERTIEIRASVASLWSFSFVRYDTIEPDRTDLVEAPPLAPASLVRP
jgi:hypothetical protein